MNLPNKLSLMRIILVPIMLIFMTQFSGENFVGWNNFVSGYGMIIALIIFSIAAYTDHLDGMIARRDGFVTDLGKFLDPIADKFLVISSFIAFTAMGRISLWVPVIVLFRELAVTGMRTIAANKGVVVPSKMFGKVKAVIQMATIITLMIEQILLHFAGVNTFTNIIVVLSNILIILTIIFTLLSGADYLYEHKDLLSE